MLNEESIKAAMKSAGIGVDIESIPVNGKFADYGLDSLDVFNLLLEVQEQTGREIPDNDVPKLDCIAAILDYFKA